MRCDQHSTPFGAPATSAVSFVSGDTAMMVPLLLRRPAHHSRQQDAAGALGGTQAVNQAGREAEEGGPAGCCVMHTAGAHQATILAQPTCTQLSDAAPGATVLTLMRHVAQHRRAAQTCWPARQTKPPEAQAVPAPGQSCKRTLGEPPHLQPHTKWASPLHGTQASQHKPNSSLDRTGRLTRHRSTHHCGGFCPQAVCRTPPGRRPLLLSGALYTAQKRGREGRRPRKRAPNLKSRQGPCGRRALLPHIHHGRTDRVLEGTRGADSSPSVNCNQWEAAAAPCRRPPQRHRWRTHSQHRGPLEQQAHTAAALAVRGMHAQTALTDAPNTNAPQPAQRTQASHTMTPAAVQLEHASLGMLVAWHTDQPQCCMCHSSGSTFSGKAVGTGMPGIHAPRPKL